MIWILFIAAWLLCGFAGAYIGHRWADKGREDTTLRALVLVGLFGPLALLGATVIALVERVNFDKVVFKRKP